MFFYIVCNDFLNFLTGALNCTKQCTKNKIQITDTDHTRNKITIMMNFPPVLVSLKRRPFLRPHPPLLTADISHYYCSWFASKPGNYSA